MVKMSVRAGGAEEMFLDVKELAVRKLRIHKAYAPGSIDFHSAEIKQIEPLEVTATAELLEGQIRVEGLPPALQRQVPDGHVLARPDAGDRGADVERPDRAEELGHLGLVSQVGAGDQGAAAGGTGLR